MLFIYLFIYLLFIYLSIYLLIHTHILGLCNYAFNTSECKVERLINEEWELMWEEAFPS